MKPPKDIEFLLCEYLDGQLDAEAAREVEELLASDEGLKKQLRLYRGVDDCLRARAGQAAGIDYEGQREDILAAVERRALVAPVPRRVLAFPRMVRALAVAALVLITVSAGILIYRNEPAEVSESQIEVKLVSSTSLQPEGDVLKISLVGTGSPRPENYTDSAGAGSVPPGTVVASISEETDSSWNMVPMFGI